MCSHEHIEELSILLAHLVPARAIDKLYLLLQITDSCPECAANQFDIQALTFNKVNVTLKQVHSSRSIATASFDSRPWHKALNIRISMNEFLNKGVLSQLKCMSN